MTSGTSGAAAKSPGPGGRWRWIALAPLLWVSLAPISSAQINPARALITHRVDESQRVTLSGNTRAEANPANDRGVVADSLSLPHLLLQLRQPPERERALSDFIDQLHDPQSPNYHHWLAASEFGQMFGPAAQDVTAVSNWLSAHGMTVNLVYPGGALIDFSATAGQVREAFKTEIHRLSVQGTQHIANMSDPQIPAALGSVVVGVVALHDFAPHPMARFRSDYTIGASGGSAFQLVPADVATIYNLNPVFSQGYTGQGQTIVVLEPTDLFNPSDWTRFRSVFGMAGYTSGSLTTVHPPPPSGANNCVDPGVTTDESEAILDAEWASAAAPSAAIVVASCAGGSFVTTTLANLINASSAPPAIVSLSYGQCEASLGTARNIAISALFQQAVAEGVSIFVASGDNGAAECDSTGAATRGIAVSGYSSTPYNVAVGGTDFADTYLNTASTYWSSTNSPIFGSAKSYIPEIPWNDTCASTLIANFVSFSTTYGSSGLCNSSFARQSSLIDTSATGGGPSKLFAKPSWQSGIIGNPNDGVRDVPDVAMMSGGNQWGHGFIICSSDIFNGGSSCSGAPSTWSAALGTSFSTPIMAGIQALINQAAGGRQGNPNTIYYQLAAQQYATSGTTCDASLGTAGGANCIFHDITLGDNDVSCRAGSPNCYAPSGSIGVLSTTSAFYVKAYGANTGWDFTTGLGSVNAYNLVRRWPASTLASPVIATATVVEFYDAHDDLYFITADPNEAAIVDSGADNVGLSVWARTGFSFKSYSSPGPGNDVCRFYNPNIPPVGVHFYTALPAECATVKATLPAWHFEIGNAFNIALPTNGACPLGYLPVYRYFDQRGDESWRFITDTSVNAAMLAKGWKNEGVQMCAPQ